MIQPCVQVYIQASRLLKGLCLAGSQKECLHLFAQILSQQPPDACLHTDHALQAALNTTASLIEANASSVIEEVFCPFPSTWFSLRFSQVVRGKANVLVRSPICIYVCCSWQVRDILLDALGVAYQHASIGVRTASQECIVELHFKFGAEGIKRLTSRLTSTQAKVVAFQYSRAAKMRLA